MAKRNLIVLYSTSTTETRQLKLVGGPRPYLWIGPEHGPTFGVVPDKDVKRLYRYCEHILESRKRAKMCQREQQQVNDFKRQLVAAVRDMLDIDDEALGRVIKLIESFEVGQ